MPIEGFITFYDPLYFFIINSAIFDQSLDEQILLKELLIKIKTATVTKIESILENDHADKSHERILSLLPTPKSTPLIKFAADFFAERLEFDKAEKLFSLIDDYQSLVFIKKL